MMVALWERVAAIGGIAYVALSMASQGLIQIGGAEPSFDAPASEIVAFFEARNTQLFDIGVYLQLLALVAFLWFLGGLWAMLRQAEGQPAWMSLIAVGSGLAFIGSLSGGWQLAVFRLGDGLDPQIARLAFDMGNLGFANSWVPLGSMMLAAGAVMLGGVALPRWLGWSAVGIGVGLLVARIVWTLFVAFIPWMLFWFWLIALAVVVLRRRRARVGAAEPAAS
jgi:hypothetical protein